MKIAKYIVIGFIGLSVIGVIAGSNSKSQTHTAVTTPASQARHAESVIARHGWTGAQIATAMVSFEERAPNATKTQDECAVMFMAARYSPKGVLALSITATTRLGEEEAHACANASE